MTHRTQRDELLAHLVAHAVRTGEFTLASGKKSNYYVNGKLTTLDARGAYLVGRVFLAMVADDVPDAVGGLTLGADPIVGAMIALAGLEDLPLKGFIVRKASKEHGTKSQVEGPLADGDRVVVVEDVVTTGGSSLVAIEAVQAMGCRVKKVLAVVDREEGGRENLGARGIALEAIFTARELLAAAAAQG
ncbi:MAG: orotate phosphoribosyltransferase [Candidatus Krumholzibacteria bacterium]|nr:orotate phosphoribosyltransferase [Candidatus Krumholzibacteria bacterium]